MAIVRVEDDGMGGSSHVLPEIIELFTREVRAIASATDGLGIGLEGVRNLMEVHPEVHRGPECGPRAR